MTDIIATDAEEVATLDDSLVEGFGNQQAITQPKKTSESDS